MDEAESADEKDAAETDQHYKVRLLRGESLERHRAVTWLNCACLPDTVPKPTFTCVLKCVFVFVLLLSVLSDFLLGQLLPNAGLPNSSAPWNIPPCLRWLLSPIAIGWKMNILIVVLVAVIYVGAFLRKLKKTSGSASQRNEEVPTISASIQQV